MHFYVTIFFPQAAISLCLLENFVYYVEGVKFILYSSF